MKIVFYELTCTVSYGGVQSFVWGMANALGRKGHTVHIYGGGGSILPDLSEGVTVLRFPFLGRERVPDLGSRFRKLVERLTFNAFSLPTLARGRYDVIYLNKPYDLPAGLIASRVSRAMVAYGSQGTEFLPFYRQLVRRLDGFFSCSGFNASQVEEYCGIRPLVLYNGVDVARFSPREVDHELRQSLGLKEKTRVLVSTCRLVGWKGIQYAIRAVATAAREFDVSYLVLGGGEYRGELESLAAKLGVAERVRFLGPVPNRELPRYYSFADAALFPSVADETFGISIAEAMACGVPVISCRVGGIPEVVAENAGILVPPREEEELARAVGKILGDAGFARELGERGRRRVVQKFSWESVANVFEGYVDDMRKGMGQERCQTGKR